ncbi:MAG: hypothetical protein [Sanya Mymon tick virus 1]|uniref:Uncharacterized protein n=1 Tax=Sanya Mymon tick virus 1 TaxID=2972216 RepID=A0A9E7V1X0_9MONO|nr:MAG: hypothetical protein [Sanya Mymon tick virus 1]
MEDLPRSSENPARDGGIWSEENLDVPLHFAGQDKVKNKTKPAPDLRSKKEKRKDKKKEEKERKAEDKKSPGRVDSRPEFEEHRDQESSAGRAVVTSGGMEWDGTEIPDVPTASPVMLKPKTMHEYLEEATAEARAKTSHPRLGPSVPPAAPQSPAPLSTQPGLASLSDAELNKLKREVLESLTASIGGTGTNFRLALNSLLRINADQTKEWLEKRSETPSQMGNVDVRLDELQGQISALQSQVAVLLERFSSRSDHENRLVEQAADITASYGRHSSTAIEAELAEKRRRREEVNRSMNTPLPENVLPPPSTVPVSSPAPSPRVGLGLLSPTTQPRRVGKARRLL